MIILPLRAFTDSETFPFHIQLGFHEDECYMHGHEDFSELVIVLDGTAEHQVGNERYPIGKGDVFVINQDTIHGYHTAVNFKICNIMFRPDLMFKPNSDIRQTAGFQALFVVAPHYLQNNHFYSRLTLTLNAFEIVRQMTDEMLAEYHKQDMGWQSLLEALFIRFCVLLSRSYQEYRNDTHSDILKLAAAIAYIEKHYTENISVSELALLSGYSERQLTRLFQSTFAVAPNRYITKLRMQKARQLLKDPACSIGEIAWSCGYEDQNYFSRVFRRETGFTPTAYRQGT